MCRVRYRIARGLTDNKSEHRWKSKVTMVLGWRHTRQSATFRFKKGSSRVPTSLLVWSRCVRKGTRPATDAIQTVHTKCTPCASTPSSLRLLVQRATSPPHRARRPRHGCCIEAPPLLTIGHGLGHRSHPSHAAPGAHPLCRRRRRPCRCPLPPPLRPLRSRGTDVPPCSSVGASWVWHCR
jgi:hypothetical protein